ncbi:hypothetical protein AC579_136 [Pseudocercospora musae]|uniref:Amino-acid acetyltransferase, mitochondrial n=1 Tax=Pseudocercospora musae TaxID=113226 RepID=A0A139ILR4_9PEZI|nr:hypothetical protein AC579_136 [Pseudocercospora musae]
MTSRSFKNSQKTISVMIRHYAGTPIHRRPGLAYQDPAAERELLVNILNANVTRRDAKQYLARFDFPRKEAAKQKNAKNIQVTSQQHESRPVHSSEQTNESKAGSLQKVKVKDHFYTHLALVCFRSLRNIDDAMLEGFAVTLSHLIKLGMQIIIVVDTNTPVDRDSGNSKTLRSSFTKQAERLCRAIEVHCPEGAQSLPSALEWTHSESATQTSFTPSFITLAFPDELSGPLERGSVLILPSIASTSSGQLRPASCTDVLLGLCQCESIPKVDRIIVVDPVGGIPDRDGQCVQGLINLSQQFEDIDQQLAKSEATNKRCQHRENLDIISKCLAVLPSSSSGLIISPETAANSSVRDSLNDITFGVGTKQKNVLIHNLLTNKPLISSSLPSGRVSRCANGRPSTGLSATLVKRGMPLNIMPAECGWQSPASGTTSMRLEDDARIDFSRLVHLIEDSFRRKLDVADYLSRVKGRVAGIIVVGEYEGCAIFTWEMPPNTQDSSRLVPYLDKFAVLQSSQGSNGVADSLFQAMVETCFPDGILWRSRTTNPVNKWYFERSSGSWQIPGSEWTMFWTGGDGALSEDRWNEYVGVCTNIRPSWADGTNPDPPPYSV